MVNIKDVAKRCNVSIATVSNVLNGKPGASDKTRKLVMKAVEELDYTPNSSAKNLKLQSTRSIGVIVEDLTVFCVPDIVDGITEYCESKGYHIILGNLRLQKKYNDKYYRETEYYKIVREEIRNMMTLCVDGIIYIPVHERIIECIPEKMKVPAVMAYGYTNSSSYPSIVVDDRNGAYIIVNYLIRQGHKKIGVISGRAESLHTKDRMKGYQKALFDNHILFDPELVREGDWERQSGYDYTDDLMEKGITAIWCMNDVMAGGVYDRLADNGRVVGRDVSVAGYDGRELSLYYRPPLTTVTLPLYEIGVKAAEIMVDMLEQGAREQELIMKIGCGLKTTASVGVVENK